MNKEKNFGIPQQLRIARRSNVYDNLQRFIQREDSELIAQWMNAAEFSIKNQLLAPIEKELKELKMGYKPTEGRSYDFPSPESNGPTLAHEKCIHFHAIKQSQRNGFTYVFDIFLIFTSDTAGDYKLTYQIKFEERTSSGYTTELSSGKVTTRNIGVQLHHVDGVDTSAQYSVSFKEADTEKISTEITTVITKYCEIARKRDG